jgi:hypothetical protein
MSALDYYGRLMRRASARVERQGQRIADPFDATAPWLLSEPDRSKREADTTPAATALTPDAPASIVNILAAKDPSSPGSEDEGHRSADRPEATPISQPSAIAPSLSPDSKPASQRTTPPPIGVRPPTTEPSGRSVDPARIERDVPIPIEPPIAPPRLPVAAFAIARDRTGVESPAPATPVAATPLAPRPPERRPLHVERAPQRDEAAVSIGVIDIEIAPPKPSPPAAPPVVVVREGHAATRHSERAADDLLRGPTHQPFGIGQV